METIVNENRSVYFTADLHLGHTNIAGPDVSNWKSGYRTFKNTHHHDSHLIDKINEKVKSKDYLFILGDFTMNNRRIASNYLLRINCNNIVILKGNHDKWSKKLKFYKAPDIGQKQVALWEQGFSKVSEICQYKEILIENQRIMLFHYPIASWNHIRRDSWCLHGHCHNTYKTDGKIFDVGVDSAKQVLGDYEPFSFEEIKKIMSNKKTFSPDGH